MRNFIADCIWVIRGERKHYQDFDRRIREDRRFRAACAAMQGMLANNEGVNRVWETAKAIHGDAKEACTNACQQYFAERAVEHADLLLAELDKPKSEE